MNPHTIFTVYAFFFGAIVGSFLNVVIYRLPRKKEVVVERSHCPSCGAMIRWCHNIPLMSYLFLRGKCAKCKSRIHWRYFVVELTSGAMAAYLFPQIYSTHAFASYVFYFAVFCILLCHFFIDIEHQILPDYLNLALLLLVLPYSVLTAPLLEWLLGGLIGFGLTYLITWAFYLWKGKIGLGGGDIKLFGVLGVLLGPVGVAQNIFLSCFLGSIVGVLLIVSKKMTKDTPLAFGPFIIIVAFIQIYFPYLLEPLLS